MLCCKFFATFITCFSSSALKRFTHNFCVSSLNSFQGRAPTLQERCINRILQEKGRIVEIVYELGSSRARIREGFPLEVAADALDSFNESDDDAGEGEAEGLDDAGAGPGSIDDDELDALFAAARQGEGRLFERVQRRLETG